jgi:hypothetical protein
MFGRHQGARAPHERTPRRVPLSRIPTQAQYRHRAKVPLSVHAIRTRLARGVLLQCSCSSLSPCGLLLRLHELTYHRRNLICFGIKREGTVANAAKHWGVDLDT